MSDTNLLHLVPVRNALEIQRINNRARVEFERFTTPVGKLFGKLFRASNTIVLTLDEKSTAVWDLIDGARNIEEIGQELKRKFGEEAEPLYERLSGLLRILESNQMIRCHPGESRNR